MSGNWGGSAGPDVHALFPFILADGPHFLSSAHLIAVAIFAAITALTILARRRLDASAAARRIDVALAEFGFAASIIVNGFYLRPSRFDPAESFPLQLCDLAAIIAPVAILTSWRWARALLYFWAFALCSQGLITPVHRPGPDNPEYWMTWLNHGVIVGFALYDLFARGFRPAWRDLARTIIITACYVVVAVSIDIAWGFNYGYLGPSKPSTATLVDALGPWPLRILWIILLAAAGMTALMVPWIVVRRLSRRPVSPPLMR